MQVQYALCQPEKSLQIIWKIGLSIVLRLVATDSSIKIVAVTGEGDYYSSGNDLSNFLEAEVLIVQQDS